MFKTEIGKLNLSRLRTLNEGFFTIKENKGRLYFEIGGNQDGDEYILTFQTIVDKEVLRKLPRNKIVDFKQYLDDGDIVLGINGVFYLNMDIKIDINHYLSDSFILNVEFKNKDLVVGCFEVIFSFED